MSLLDDGDQDDKKCSKAHPVSNMATPARHNPAAMCQPVQQLNQSLIAL
jgi:hypothetical protein